MPLTSIDVGAAAIDRAANAGPGYTLVSKANAANASGYITTVQIYTNETMGTIQVAAFSASGDNLTTNGLVSLADASAGLNTYNAPEDFIAFAISSGEYIGIYFATGNIDYVVGSGSGDWSLLGDFIPCTNQAFDSNANTEMSLYATGYDVLRGWINVGDDWKLIEDIQINIGDSWKTVSEVDINIGDDWKTIW